MKIPKMVGIEEEILKEAKKFAKQTGRP